MENKIITFQSRFGKPEVFNSSFHKVKIYVAYAGKNRNMSIISKETFEKIIPSIYGIPIVGDYHDDSFHGHGGKVVIDDDGINYYDTTRAFGFIDSSAKVDWEMVTEEDGTENEYLTVDGFLWTEKYPESLKALDGNHNQSMELIVKDAKVSEEDENYFEILDAEFLALCILSPDVEPAFESAGISQFNLDKEEFKLEFTQMVAELKQSLKGGENVGEKNKKGFAKGETEEKEDTQLKNFIKTFELSHSDIRIKLYQLIAPIEEQDDTWYWISDVYDEYFIYSNDAKYYKQGYIKTDVDVALKGERVEVFAEYLTADELTELNKMRDTYASLVEKNKELEIFKEQKEKEEFEAKQEKIRQEKIDYINTEYEKIPDDVKELFISKVDEYETVEDLDADICVYIVKNKVVFSKTKDNKSPSVKLGLEKENNELKLSPYGNLF